METTAPKVRASVIPLVSTKTSNVFLLHQDVLDEEVITQLVKNLKANSTEGFPPNAVDFLTAEGVENVSVWKSRISRINASKLGAAMAKQRAFWVRIQFKPVN